MRQRTRISNQLRSLLAEYGIVAAQGVATLRRIIPEVLEDAENGLSHHFRALLHQGYCQLQELDAHIVAYDRELKEQVKASETAQR